MKILVTGSGGLIGSEAVIYYSKRCDEIIGIDNNMRQSFFGPEGDVTWNINRLEQDVRNYKHLILDIRDRKGLHNLFKKHQFDLIIHCAAQPSHDKAKEIPFLDFEINALGTLNLLEMTRRHCPEAIFIHLSSNKVYGDIPNQLPLKELETRWDYANSEDVDGISENCQIDQTIHSLFGASKIASDVLAQEYGRYFNMKVGIFRGGCLTGPFQSGVKLHGFLSYLVKMAIHGNTYTILGYKGKQVRDIIHSYDVIKAFDSFIESPKYGEVYNIGGGRTNSVSILEAITLIQETIGKKIHVEYDEKNRIGDHVCYISNLKKIKSHFPTWEVKICLSNIIEEIVKAESKRKNRTYIL